MITVDENIYEGPKLFGKKSRHSEAEVKKEASKGLLMDDDNTDLRV